MKRIFGVGFRQGALPTLAAALRRGKASESPLDPAWFENTDADAAAPEISDYPVVTPQRFEVVVRGRPTRQQYAQCAMAKGLRSPTLWVMIGRCMAKASTFPAERRVTGGRRPPIRVGQSSINASDFSGLQRAWRTRQLVIFVGAGISLEYGIPAWRDLVVDLLFERTARSRRMGDLPPEYRRALGRWLAEYFDYDLTVLARVIRQDVVREHRRKKATPEDAEREFLQCVRKRLYATLRESPETDGAHGTTLEAVAQLIELSRRDGNVVTVVTFNFDDLLERELHRRGVITRTVTNAGRRSGPGLPIIHPHGCLPVQGPLNDDPIVFSEQDYHRLTDTAYHWAPTTIVSLLRQYTVLFVGLSMSDPHLRRLLDACRTPGGIPQHWNVQRRHAVSKSQSEFVNATVERYAEQWAHRIGTESEQIPLDLDEALRATLRQADTYDREVLESMGSKTIWLESFADLPLLLQRIPTPAPSTRQQAGEQD